MIRFIWNPHREKNDIEALVKSLYAIEIASFSDPWTETSFYEMLASEAVSLALLCEDTTPIGYGFFAVVVPEGEVLNLAVAPKERAKGYGREILQRSIAVLEEKGVTDLFLEVRERNTPARTLYQSQGFREIGIRKNYYRYPVENAVVMKRMSETE